MEFYAMYANCVFRKLKCQIFEISTMEFQIIDKGDLKF